MKKLFASQKMPPLFISLLFPLFNSRFRTLGLLFDFNRLLKFNKKNEGIDQWLHSKIF